MGRFTTVRYEPTLKPEYSFEGLQALYGEIETGLEELTLLNRLQYNMENIAFQRDTRPCERLVIASSINSIIGKQSPMAVSIESVNIMTAQYDDVVSLEGVGQMLSDGAKWVAQKIKEFFQWLGGLIKKIFSRDTAKAEKYKKASKFDYEKVNRDFKENMERMKKDADEATAKMAKDMEDLMKSSDNLNEKMKDFENIRNRAKDANPKSASKDDLASTLRHLRVLISGTSNANQGEYLIGGNRRVPYKTAQEFVEFTKIAGKQVPQAMREFTKVKHDDTDMDDLKNTVKKVQGISHLSKYFEETDEDGITYLSVRREEGKKLIVKNGFLFDILSNCSDALIDIVTTLKAFERAEKLMQFKVDSEHLRTNDKDRVETNIKVAKTWLKIMTSYTKTLGDIRSFITYVGDDLVKVVESLEG